MLDKLHVSGSVLSPVMQSGCLVSVVSGGGPEFQGQLEVMGVMRVEITDL